MTVTIDGSSTAFASLGSFEGDGSYDTASGLSSMTMDLGSLVAGKIEIVQHGTCLHPDERAGRVSRRWRASG